MRKHKQSYNKNWQKQYNKNWQKQGIFLAADILAVLGRPVWVEPRDLWSSSEVTESEKALEETLPRYKEAGWWQLARIPPQCQSTAVRRSDVWSLRTLWSWLMAAAVDPLRLGRYGVDEEEAASEQSVSVAVSRILTSKADSLTQMAHPCNLCGPILKDVLVPGRTQRNTPWAETLHVWGEGGSSGSVQTLTSIRSCTM